MARDNIKLAIKNGTTELFAEEKTLFVEHLDSTPIDSPGDYRNIKGLTINQEILNGDFSNGTTNWIELQSTNSVTNNILSNTGNGTQDVATVRQSPISNVLTGEKIFVYCRARVTNPDALTLLFRIINPTAVNVQTINTPIQNQWYEMYGTVITISDDILGIDIRHSYVDSSTQNGKIMEVDGNYGVFGINMTELGIELYSDEKMLDLVRQGYFEGLTSVSKDTTVTAFGTNLIDKTGVTTGVKIDNTTGNESASIGDNATEFIRLKNGENYVLSGLTNTTPSGAYYDSQQNYISGFTSYASLTIPTNAYYIRLTIDDLDLDTTQLEKGTVATTYIPHQNQVVTFNFQDDLRSVYGESLIQDNANLGQVERNVGYDFNNSVQNASSWTITATLTNTHLFNIDLYSILGYAIPLNNDTKAKILSKIGNITLNTVTANNNATNDIEYQISINSLNNNLSIRMNKTTYPDSASFETYLQANDVTFQYELETPTQDTYNEVRFSTPTEYSLQLNTQFVVGSTNVLDSYQFEVSKSLGSSVDDNRETGNKNGNNIAQMHRVPPFTFIQGNWSQNPTTLYWEYLITDAEVEIYEPSFTGFKVDNLVEFAPDIASQSIWQNSLPFVTGGDTPTGQALFIVGAQPSADMSGELIIKGVVQRG